MIVFDVRLTLLVVAPFPLLLSQGPTAPAASSGRTDRLRGHARYSVNDRSALARAGSSVEASVADSPRVLAAARTASAPTSDDEYHRDHGEEPAQ